MILKYTAGIKSLVLLLLCSILGHGAFAQNKEVVVDKIVAKVDNYIILKSELEKMYLDYLSKGELMGANAKCQILESLVINKLMVAKAEIDSVVVSEGEVNSNLDRRMQYFVNQIGSEEKIEQYYGKSLEEFKDELRDNVKEQLIVQKMQSEITANIKVTPSEVKKFFNSIPSDSLPFFSTEVTVGQIVKIPTIAKEQKEKVRQELIELRQKIVSGEADFQEMAKKHSDEPGAENSGGNIGFFKRGELAPEYEAAALKLKPGEISMPVETKFGFHLIQMIERRGNLFNTRHILIIPSSSKLDIGEAENYLDSIRTKIINEEITFEKAAKEHSEDMETSASGGFFLDESGSNRISVEELDPSVFFAIDTMQVGTISKPLPYRTPDGKDAVRILFYKTKMRPHQANLKEDYQKIQAAALNEKKNRILSKWFSEANKDVFILIDDEYNFCEILQ